MGMVAESLNLSVLIVESDRHTREALSIYCRILGCPTRVAGNATEALAAMREQKFDLIIADYWLPDGDGASLLQSSVARRERAVRFLTTAYSSDPCPIREDLTGIDEVVHKPFTGCELRSLIGRHAFRRTDRNAEDAVERHR